MKTTLEGATVLNFGPITEASFNFGTSDFVVLYGENQTGKSTFTGALFEILKRGEIKSFKPLKEGAETGKAEYTLSNGTKIILELEEGKSRLRMVNELGKQLSQAETKIRLKDLIGNVGAFDLNKYIQTTAPSELRKMIEDLVPGLSQKLSEVNHQYKQAYEARRDAARDLKTQEARVQSFDPKLAKSEPVSVEALAREKDEIVQQRQDYDAKKGAVFASENALAYSKDEVDRITEMLRAAKEEMKERKKQLLAAQKEFQATPQPDIERVDAINDEIAQADAKNRAIYQAKESAREAEKVKEFRAKWQELEDKIKEIESEKSKIISAAKLPVDGMELGLSGEEILLNGFPLSDATNTAAKVIAGLEIKANELGSLKFLHVDMSSLDWHNAEKVMGRLREMGIRATLEYPSRKKGETGLNIEIAEKYFE